MPQNQSAIRRINKFKNDFPIFKRRMNGKPLLYLDSAATAQKPTQVIKALSDFYLRHNANVHRSSYLLAEEASEMYENARKKVAYFLGASVEEIIFTGGATEALNLAAFSWGEANIKRDDNIITTIIEHHSNFLPWLLLCRRKGAKLKIVPLTKGCRLDFGRFYKLIDGRTKLVTITHASNVLGTINPIEEIIPRARIKNKTLRVLVDGAQAAPHIPVNVNKLDCDFYVISGHKLMGPTGIGALYAKKEILEAMPPFMTGGHMIKKVTSYDVQWNDAPWRFEAGTPRIAQAIGLGTAIDYLECIGMRKIKSHENELTKYALAKFGEMKELEIYGPKDTENRLGVISFNIKGAHAHDVATLLDHDGIAIRAGHQCAMPLHREALKIEASLRASFYIYNTKEDIDKLVAGLSRAQKILNLN